MALNCKSFYHIYSTFPPSSFIRCSIYECAEFAFILFLLFVVVLYRAVFIIFRCIFYNAPRFFSCCIDLFNLCALLSQHENMYLKPCLSNYGLCDDSWWPQIALQHSSVVCACVMHVGMLIYVQVCVFIGVLGFIFLLVLLPIIILLALRWKWSDSGRLFFHKQKCKEWTQFSARFVSGAQSNSLV